MALLALHEQDLVLGGLEKLDRLGHRRRVDPVFRIHEELSGRLDRRAGARHFFQHALVHQRLGHVLADRRLVAFPPEIAGKRLFADDMLAGPHRLDDHRRRAGWAACRCRSHRARGRRSVRQSCGKPSECCGGAQNRARARPAPRRRPLRHPRHRRACRRACAAPRRSRSRRGRLLFFSFASIPCQRNSHLGAAFCRSWHECDVQ